MVPPVDEAIDTGAVMMFAGMVKLIAPPLAAVLAPGSERPGALTVEYLTKESAEPGMVTQDAVVPPPPPPPPPPQVPV